VLTISCRCLHVDCYRGDRPPCRQQCAPSVKLNVGRASVLKTANAHEEDVQAPSPFSSFHLDARPRICANKALTRLLPNLEHAIVTHAVLAACHAAPPAG
jgi:hypothetical protein